MPIFIQACHDLSSLLDVENTEMNSSLVEDLLKRSETGMQKVSVQYIHVVTSARKTALLTMVGRDSSHAARGSENFPWGKTLGVQR